MKRINLSIAVVLLLCTAVTTTADAFDPQDDLWIWKQAPATELALDPLTPAGLPVFENNLDVDEDTPSFGQLRADLSQYLPNICLMTTPMTYDGTNINSMRLDFGDESVKDDAASNSKVTLNKLDIVLYYSIPFVKTVSRERLNVDLGINVRTIAFDDDNDSHSLGQEAESMIMPLPMVFAAVQFHPSDVLALEAEGQGISIDGKRSYGLIGRLRWKSVGPIYAAGGYRFRRYEIDHDGSAVDAAISGPFIEAGLSF